MDKSKCVEKFSDFLRKFAPHWAWNLVNIRTGKKVNSQSQMKQNASGFIITKDTRTCRHAAAERSANTQSEISLCVLVFLVLAQRCHSGFKKKTKNTNCKLKLTKPSTAAAVIFSYINRAGGKLNFPHSCSYFPKMMTKIRSWPKISEARICADLYVEGASCSLRERSENDI